MTSAAAANAAAGEQPTNESGAERGHSTVNVRHELLALARGAVRLVRTSPTGRAYSMRQFIEEAITAQIRTIAETYNDGRAILPDANPLRPGQRSR